MALTDWAFKEIVKKKKFDQYDRRSPSPINPHLILN